MQRLILPLTPGRLARSALLGLAALSLAGLPVRAQESPAETARLHLFDACVVALWKAAKSQPEMDAVSRRCRCAAPKAMSSLSVDEAETVSWSKPLTGKPREAVFEALKACN